MDDSLKYMMSERTVKVDKIHYYDMYKKLCEMHKFPALHIDNIEEVFVHFKEGLVTHSCFKWNTGSKICILGFPLSNLGIGSKYRKGCLSKFFKDMVEQCTEDGYNLIWTTSGTERIIEVLEENGFTHADKNVQQYIKITDNVSKQ